ncbi:hypothetical protein [Mesorhizobium sp. M1396]|uniref:hypothetical protein n=1 Tax=Mesorhizobium sp. M1396 TaxID=2957095 RepID=UPI003336E6FF
MLDSDEFGAKLLQDPSFVAGAAEGLAASNVDEDPILSFFDRVRYTTLKSLDKAAAAGAGAVGGAPAILVLSERPQADAKAIDVNAHRLVDIDLKDPADWQGKLVICASHATAGWWIELPEGSVDQALELLNAHGLGHSPLAIVYPAARALSCFQDGGMSDEPPIKLDLPLNSRQVTLNDIFEVLEDVRKNSLLTPMIGPPKFWNDGPAYVPGEEAERQIQWIAAAQLRSNFRPLIVDTEQVTPVGRIDIVMTNTAGTGAAQQYPAIIELKALKSKTHAANKVPDSTNVKAILKGIRQAKAYRETKGANLGVMASFDMRATKTDILNEELCKLAVAKYITDERIAVYNFYVYGDTAHAQDEAAAA